MRVKIAYTVEIEEVEKKVSEIISNAIDDIEFANQETMRIRLDLSTKTGNLEDKVNMLEKIRVKLASADQVIDDCYLILEGLRQAKLEIQEKEDEIQDG